MTVPSGRRISTRTMPPDVQQIVERLLELGGQDERRRIRLEIRGRQPVVDERADRRRVAAHDRLEDRLRVRRRDQNCLGQRGDPDDHQEHAEDEQKEDRSS